MTQSGHWTRVGGTSAARVPLIDAGVARLIYINGVSRGRSSFFY